MFQMGTSLKFTGLIVFPNPSNINRIDGVMVSMLASSEVDRGFDPGRVKPKTIKMVFVASLLSTQH